MLFQVEFVTKSSIAQWTRARLHTAPVGDGGAGVEVRPEGAGLEAPAPGGATPGGATPRGAAPGGGGPDGNAFRGRSVEERAGVAMNRRASRRP